MATLARFNPSVSEVSFLLVKPDGMELPAVIGRIEDFLGESGLTVVADFRTRLDALHVAKLWPQFTADKCPYTFELLRCYVAARDCRIIVVQGAGAIATCQRLKHQIRREFSATAFANRLHCPSNDIELRFQLPVVCPPLANRLRLEAAATPSNSYPGVFGRLAKRLPIDVHQDIAAIIEHTALARLPNADLGKPGLMGVELMLHNDADHSLDFVASCLAETFSEWTSIQAVSVALEVDRCGELCLADLIETDASDKAKRLTEWGLDVRIRLNRSAK